MDFSIFQPIRGGYGGRRRCRRDAAHRAQSRLECDRIPYKEATKPQQKKRDDLRGRREYAKLKKPTTGNVPPAIHEKKEKERGKKLGTRRSQRIKQREAKMASVDEWLVENDGKNENVLDGNGCNVVGDGRAVVSAVRSSKRNIKPSKDMTESMKYQQSMNKRYPLMSDIVTSDDDDEEDEECDDEE